MKESLARRDFNIAGPCMAGEHYMLEPLRSVGHDLLNCINAKKYFIVHAPLQSGVTTLLQNFVEKLNAAGNFYAFYCSLEVLDAFDEPEKSIPAIINTVKYAIESYKLPGGFAENADFGDFANALKRSLAAYCKTLGKPLVIFFDDIGCLPARTLTVFLRQLRSGYISRDKSPFVHSIALAGLQNPRGYTDRVHSAGELYGGASPFNIFGETVSLKNFIKTEIASLYSQHTVDTGQVFLPQLVDYVFEQTQGHPWLVNAIARECVEKIARKNYSVPITPIYAEQAIQNITVDRRTHIGCVMGKLREARVRKIIEPLILGADIERGSDDYLYAKDLGLIKEAGGKTEAANPIYAELIIRALSGSFNLQPAGQAQVNRMKGQRPGLS
ncbi:MAG: AAA-like domain-containing protein [Spirochaetes bacterium]|nr:AAA-like domain-containing protein [Spirochaetota bacterium]